MRVWSRRDPPDVPPLPALGPRYAGLPPLVACFVTAIEMARSLAELGACWHDNQDALRSLGTRDLAMVVALKDHRKAVLAARVRS